MSIKPSTIKKAVKDTNNHAPVNNNDQTYDHNERILKYLGQNCGHYTKSGGYYYGHNKDPIICNDICQIIQKHGSIDDNNCKNFIQMITLEKTQPYYYYESKKNCSTENGNKIKEVLKIIFKSYFPEEGEFKNLLKYTAYDLCYQSLKEYKDFTYYTPGYIQEIVNRLNNLDHEKDNNQSFISQFIDHIASTDENLSVMVNCKNEIFSAFTSQLIDKFEGNLSNELLTNACYALPYNKQVINSLIGRGMVLTDEHLSIVCSLANLEAIDFILAISKMPIKQIHFKKLIESTRKKEKDPRYYWRYREDERVSNCTPEKIEILIKHGYKISYEDLKLSIKNKQIIPGIERFDIKLDKALLEYCWANDFYPPYNFDCIDPEMLQLEKLCNGQHLADVKALINKHKLVPDQKCMENAAKFKTSNRTMDFLISKGGKVNINCVENCAKEQKSNRLLLTIVNEFKKNYNNEVQDYKDRIQKLEEIIKDLGGEVPKDKKEENKNSKLEPKTTKTPKKPTSTLPKGGKKAKTAAQSKNKNVIIIDEESDEELEMDETNPKEETPQNGVQHSENNYQMIDLKIDQNKIVEIQKQYKLKSSSNENIQSIFKIPKNKKVSYNDVKKILLDKIKDESWIDQKDKSLIKIPDDIKKKLNIESNDYIKFNDIDKLVCLFFV